jgi:UDP-N-acetylglucosamine--N-acetylmuramyl-(pentapeptide) pyrophosphoryl-undecaprenol N-acetylglucosamine transferase
VEVKEDAVWVTFDTAQSRALLAERRHIFVPFIASRDARAVMRSLPIAYRIIRATRPSIVISTGNAVALSFLPAAQVAGAPAAYIESAARTEGPSLTGRLIRWTPGVALFTQYQEWARPPWRYIGSVFDEFRAADSRPPKRIARVVVTLGTIPFDFRRLAERVAAILPAGCDVTWQVGVTNVADLGIDACVSLSPGQLQKYMRDADVVIAHAGIGSALAALEAGKCPILVPRTARQGEHVDDHQHQIAAALSARGLALHRTCDTLVTADLYAAAQRSVVTPTDLPRLALTGHGDGTAT